MLVVFACRVWRGAIYVKVSGGHRDRQTDILEEKLKKMPPQLEANKKQHLQHWEEKHASDIYTAVIILFFWLSYTWCLEDTHK